MSAKTEQATLDIKAEKFTKVERKIMKVLGRYRIIDKRIEYYTRLANGIGLRHQPSITAAPPVEDDPIILSKLKNLRESEREIASTVERYVSKDEFQWAARYRVVRKLQTTYGDNADDDYLLRDAYDLLRRRPGEERVELTDTERLAILREAEIESAKSSLSATLIEKENVEYALGVMKECYEPEYWLLWHRDVQGMMVREVCDAIGLNYLTEEETYKKRIRKARERIAKWFPVQFIASIK